MARLVSIKLAKLCCEMPEPVTRCNVAVLAVSIVAETLIAPALESPMTIRLAVIWSSSASVRLSCPEVSPPRLIARLAVCGVRVTVLAEVSVAVLLMAMSSAMNVTVPVPDTATSEFTVPRLIVSAVTLRLLLTANASGELKLTVSVPLWPSMTKVGGAVEIDRLTSSF
jgi:hypothetical protein